MPGKTFLDTNVLIYALTRDDPRNEQAEQCLAEGGVISVQVLNEFVSVARRKILMPWRDIRDALGAIRILCAAPVPITIETHEAALDISETYGYGFYDALVIGSALQAGCTTLYSEDLRDGQIINEQLTIRNPFQASRKK